MKLTVRPISDRSPFTGQHRESNFGVTYSQMRDLLDRELWFLDAENAVLELDCEERHIRVDGDIRADASLASPAVRLAFDSNQGPLIYATDAFTRRSYKRGVMEKDWHHNLYAIAKSLEALRLVDRYGVTGSGQQYTGFKALPTGRAMPASHMTRDQALTIFADLVKIPVEHLNCEAGSLRSTWRRARREVHPDRRNGDRTLWDQVEQAAAVLGVAE